MRELKFRIWDKQQKKFHTDADWGISLQGSFIIGFASHDSWNHDKGYKINLANQDKLVVQQYTGLKDKNGKEIYEGDIVSGEFYDTEYHHSETIKAEVIFNNGAFNIAIREWHKPSLKIVGNIFENPELIRN